MADTFVKGLSIKITTSMLTAEFREKLVKLIKQHKGNAPLSLFLYDPEKNWNIEFLSHKFRVAVTGQLIEELEAAGIKYSITKK